MSGELVFSECAEAEDLNPVRSYNISGWMMKLGVLCAPCTDMGI